mmetsp:Transcript_12041/g.26356  ORF Transcript_12041/g.26356 Transcript_12041/m.26356 type:complete len:208 (+) Transcript_12041:309-932(+)
MSRADACRAHPSPQASAVVINSSRTIYRSILASAASRAACASPTRSSMSFMLSLFFPAFASSTLAWASAAAISSASTWASMTAYSSLSFLDTLIFFFFPFSAFCWASMVSPSRSSARLEGPALVFLGGGVLTGLGGSGGGGGLGSGGVRRMVVVVSAFADAGTVAAASVVAMGSLTGSGGGESNPVRYLVNPGAAPFPALSAVKYSE